MTEVSVWILVLGSCWGFVKMIEDAFSGICKVYEYFKKKD